jgi:hypothetical protein
MWILANQGILWHRYPFQNVSELMLMLAPGLSHNSQPSAGILCIRTWAIWHNNKSVGIGLTCLTLVNTVFQLILFNKYVRAMECTCNMYRSALNIFTKSYYWHSFTPTISRIQGVFYHKSFPWLVDEIYCAECSTIWWALLTPTLLVFILAHIFVVILTLVVISAFRSCSFLCFAIHCYWWLIFFTAFADRQSIRGGLSHVIHRDGQWLS